MTLPKNMKALIDEETENINNTLGIADPTAGIIKAAESLKKRIARSKAVGQPTTHAEAEPDDPRQFYRGERLVTETGGVKRKGAFHVFDPKLESRDDFKKRTGLTIKQE